MMREKVCRHSVPAPLNSMNTRRTFLKSSSATAAAALTSHLSLLTSHSALAADAKGPSEYCFFTKHLHGLSFDQIADIAADVGVQGIEAPIRPGGHVEPDRIEEDLPKLAEALKKRGLKLTIMTSGINEV